MERERPIWLVRLTDEIRKRTEDGATNKLSYRQLCEDASVGENYVTQLMSEKNWKEPLFSNVVKLCDALHVSITYIVTGVNMTQREEEVLRQWGRLDAPQQEQLLGLVQTLLRGNGPSQ